MKKYQGHLYETNERWHPVVVRQPTDVYDCIVYLPRWLADHCPDCDSDYDAYLYPGENIQDSRHKTIYFFRDKKIAVLFALRWS